LPKDPNILVDIDTHDDAGVLPRSMMILRSFLLPTFFPPVCSDPYEFGQIAAANSISDVYAMGGDPVLALNIICFPQQSYDGDLCRHSEKVDLTRPRKQE